MNQKGNDTESENPTPWNRWFRQANADDPGAAHSIIVAAQPLIQHLCNVPLFRNQLGKDEIYSIAYYTLVKFINKKKNLPDDAEIPFLLLSVIRCALLDSIRNMDVRQQYEQLARSDSQEDYATGSDCNDSYYNKAAAEDNTTEPEAHYLKSDLRHKVREAIKQLPDNEKNIICALYFQHKTMKEIAQSLHCTFQNAYKTRQKAYAHLHKILKKTMFS